MEVFKTTTAFQFKENEISQGNHRTKYEENPQNDDVFP